MLVPTDLQFMQESDLKRIKSKTNRTIPPLKYDVVKKLKNLNPELLMRSMGFHKYR